MIERGLAGSTVRTNYGVLRAIFGWAVENDLLARSPCRGIRLPEIVASHRPVVSAEDIFRLADAMRTDYRVASLLGALGLRTGRSLRSPGGFDRLPSQDADRGRHHQRGGRPVDRRTRQDGQRQPHDHDADLHPRPLRTNSTNCSRPLVVQMWCRVLRTANLTRAEEAESARDQGLCSVEVSGFEPPTSTLRTWRSAELSYTPEGRARIAEAPVSSSGLPPATTVAPPAWTGAKYAGQRVNQPIPSPGAPAPLATVRPALRR